MNQCINDDKIIIDDFFIFQAMDNFFVLLVLMLSTLASGGVINDQEVS